MARTERAAVFSLQRWPTFHPTSRARDAGGDFPLSRVIHAIDGRARIVGMGGRHGAVLRNRHRDPLVTGRQSRRGAQSCAAGEYFDASLLEVAVRRLGVFPETHSDRS